VPSATFAKLTAAPRSLSEGGAFFVYVVSASAISVSLSEGLLTALNPLIAIFSCALAYGLFWLLYRYRWASFAFLAALALSAAYLYAFQRLLLSALGSEVLAMAKNLLLYIQGQEALDAHYLTAYWLCASLALNAYAFAFVVIKPRLAALALPFTSLIIAYWFVGLPSALAMLAMLSLALWYWYGASQARSVSAADVKGNADEDQGLRLWRRGARRGALVIVLIALSIPALEVHERLEQRFGSFFRAIPGSEKLIEAYGATRSGGEAKSFSFIDTGFQGEADRLGGPVRLVDTPIYRVEGPLPLYLRGSIKARYEGDAWRAAALAPRARKSGSALFDSPDGAAKFFIRIRALNSSYRTIFSPYRALVVASPYYDGFTQDEDGNMRFPDGVYRDEYYELLLPAEYPADMAPEALEPDSRRRYLELPASLPSRVRELAAAIAQTAEATELARALALRDRLRSSYPYNLEARAAPEGRDFVDFFLFEEQKGYCSYYASALAIMLRSIGIPSRYVEGYLAQREEEDGSAIVRQRDAHSWVEAYIEPYGWLSLEATPAFPVIDPLQPWPGGSAAYTTARILQPLTRPGLENPDRALLYVSQAAKALALALAAALLIAILFVLPGRVLYSRSKRRRLERALSLASVERRYCALYLYSLELMALSGHAIERGETAREYASRIKARFYIEEAPFTRLSALFEDTHYGGHSLGPEPEARIRLFVAYLEGRLKARLGCLPYLWMRFILAKPLPRL
jgi:transglutaminase-like putative cysteine protease